MTENLHLAENRLYVAGRGAGPWSADPRALADEGGWCHVAFDWTQPERQPHPVSALCTRRDPDAGLLIAALGHEKAMAWGPRAPAARALCYWPLVAEEQCRAAPGSRCHRSDEGTSLVVGHAERRLERIAITNLRITILPENLPDKRATDPLVFEGIEGLTLRNVEVFWDREAPKPKWGSALVLRDVADLVLQDFRGDATQPQGPPAIRKKNVTEGQTPEMVRASPVGRRPRHRELHTVAEPRVQW